MLQKSQSRRGSKQSIHTQQASQYPTRFDFDHEKIQEKTASKPKTEQIKTSSSTEKDSTDADPKSPVYRKYDVAAATFMDVAVLRCLFISHWQEEGVYWSLHFLYNRYLETSANKTEINPSWCQHLARKKVPCNLFHHSLGLAEIYFLWPILIVFNNQNNSVFQAT